MPTNVSTLAAGMVSMASSCHMNFSRKSLRNGQSLQVSHLMLELSDTVVTAGKGRLKCLSRGTIAIQLQSEPVLLAISSNEFASESFGFPCLEPALGRLSLTL